MLADDQGIPACFLPPSLPLGANLCFSCSMLHASYKRERERERERERGRDRERERTLSERETGEREEERE